MIHPHTELRFISPEIGYGVVATQTIPAGAITWIQDRLDRVFTPKELHALDPLFQDILETYTFRNQQGNLVLCWDHARFVNHSFKANCLSTAYDFEVSVRDINPGEQLTDDYGYLNITQPFRGVDEGTKRKTVYPDDLKKYHKTWDAQLTKVFPKITKVHQPLQTLINKTLWEDIQRIAKGEMEMKSILENHYDPKDPA